MVVLQVKTVMFCDNSDTRDHLVGQVVKASVSRAGDPGFESGLGGFF